MRKILFIFALFSIALSKASFAQDFKGKSHEVKIEAAQQRLDVGENLTYSIEWLGIPVMKISIAVKETKEVSGHHCYHVQATATPNNFFRMFYDVEHKVDSFIDTRTFLPVRFEKVRKERDKSTNLLIEFDRQKNEAKVDSGRSLTVKIEPGTLDLLSAFYYFRLLNIEEGKIYTTNVLYERKSWPVKITVRKPYLKDIHKKGTFAVIVMCPSTDLVSYLLGRPDSEALFSADSKRIPLLFTLNTKLGVLRGLIQDIPK